VNGVIGTLGTVRGAGGLRFVAPPRGRTLIRFVAANAFSVYNISIDGCTMQVVQLDSTQVEPVNVTWFALNIGQRVTVLVNWEPVSSGRWGASGVFMRIHALASLYASPLSYIPPYEAPYAPDLKRLIALFLATVQFKSVAEAGFVKPDYSAYTTIGAPPVPLLTSEQRRVQRDFNLNEARPVIKRAAPTPTHGVYFQINVLEDAKGIPTADFNGILGHALMNSSATADGAYGSICIFTSFAGTHSSSLGYVVLYLPLYPFLVFTLAGVYGKAAATSLSSSTRYTVSHRAPIGSLAEKELAGLKPVLSDRQGRYLLPGAYCTAPCATYKHTLTRICLTNSNAAGSVVKMFWNNTDAGEHPIHLHGHPFYLVATSFNPPGSEHRFAPYFMRRDVATIAGSGWAEYLFVVDYASVIMLHCHIGKRAVVGP
jgi:hypothetical protein